MFLHCFCSNQGSPPIWQHAVWNARGSTASFVTAVSNLLDLLSLHFSRLVRKPKATHTPGYKLTPCRTIHRHSWSSCIWRHQLCLRLMKHTALSVATQRTWCSSRADLGCFEVHVLAHSSTKSTLVCYLQLLIHLSAPCSETLLSQKTFVLLVTCRADTALTGNPALFVASCHLCQHQSLWLRSFLQR